MAKRVRKRKKKPGISLAIPKNAELVVKETILIAANGDAIPEIRILGNAKGFTYLSRMCAFMADWTRRHADPDIEAHFHVESYQPPFNQRLTDRMEFRLVPLWPKGRRAVLALHKATVANRQQGSLVGRYRAIAARAEELEKKYAAIDREWEALQRKQRREAARKEDRVGAGTARKP